MSDVPAGEQGTAIRAIRGKQLHDAATSQAMLENASMKKPFVHGTRKNNEPFNISPYVGDNYENKREKRRVELSDSRETIVKIKLAFTEVPSRLELILMNLSLLICMSMIMRVMIRVTAKCRSVKINFLALGLARRGVLENLGNQITLPREGTTRQ